MAYNIDPDELDDHTWATLVNQYKYVKKTQNNLWKETLIEVLNKALGNKKQS